MRLLQRLRSRWLSCRSRATELAGAVSTAAALTLVFTASPAAQQSGPGVLPGGRWIQGIERAIAVSGTPVSVPEHQDEYVLATIIIPPNTLGATGRVTVDASFAMTASTTPKTFRMRLSAVGDGDGLGGTAMYGIVIQAGTVLFVRPQWGFFATGLTTQLATSGSNSVLGFGTNSAPPVSTSLDSTEAIRIVLSGEKDDAMEDLTLLGYRVSILPW